MKIHLITNINNKGILIGTTPTIQEICYWFNAGYKHITHATNDAITISKVNIGNTMEHCNYPRSTIYKR